MEWKAIYNTNNEFVDAQHKELVRIVNELENSLARGDSDVPQNMSSVLTCVKYCIEVKQKIIDESAIVDADVKSQPYSESLKELLDFFTSADIGARKKIGFIVQWLKNHLISEKERFANIATKGISVQDVKSRDYSDGKKALNAKYEKLKSLFTKKLISADDFKENKGKIFTEFLFKLGLENFDGVYDELDELTEKNYISDKEKTEYLAMFLKKSGIEDALSKINDVDGKLRYLIALRDNELITEEKFLGMKNKIIEACLEMEY